ncbi:MAG: DUF5009 domain-containing protein [Rikenellaceae bacterium]
MDTTTKSTRLQSLDALRGFDMFFIMGGELIFLALAQLFPCAFFESIAHQMHHVEWHGFAFMDMVFPLFLFIAGISFPFSLGKKRECGFSSRQIYLNIVRRGITLIALGVIYNGILQFDFENMRYASVLGRIGLGWMIAALIFINTKFITRVIIFVSLLIGYWLIVGFIAAPDVAAADPLSMEGWFGGYIDRLALPGQLYKTVHDPEGLFSTITAVCTAMLGMFTGEFIKLESNKFTPRKKVLTLLGIGAAFVVIGLLWDIVFPINKNMWTSSFVVFVGGLSMLLFAMFYYVIDVCNYRKWTLFFTVIGMNSITIYIGQRIIDFDTSTNFLFGGIINHVPQQAQPLIVSLGYTACCWIFLYILYRKKMFLKV